jgi:hypothetical protein
MTLKENKKFKKSISNMSMKEILEESDSNKESKKSIRSFKNTIIENKELAVNIFINNLEFKQTKIDQE